MQTCDHKPSPVRCRCWHQTLAEPSSNPDLLPPKAGQGADPDRPAPHVGSASDRLPVDVSADELEATMCALIIARGARPEYAHTFDALLRKYGRDRDAAAAWQEYEHAHAVAHAKRRGKVVAIEGAS